MTPCKESIAISSLCQEHLQQESGSLFGSPFIISSRFILDFLYLLSKPFYSSLGR